MAKGNPIKIRIIKPQQSEAQDKVQPDELLMTEEIFESQTQIENQVESQAGPDIWQRIAKVCLYVLVGLLPLFFLPITIVPVEINKQIFATILVLICFLCYLIHSLNNRKIVYPKSIISLAILIFLALSGLSAVISLAQENAIFGNFIQPATLWSFLLAGLSFFLASVFIKKDDLTGLGKYFFLGLILTTIFGLLQIFGKFILPWDFTRVINFNSIGSTTQWGIFITFGLAMIITSLISLEFSKRQKIILLFGAALIIFSLIVLNSQLLFSGLAVAMLILIFFKLATKAKINLPVIIIIFSLFFVLINGRLPGLVNLPIEARPNISTTGVIIKGTLTGKQILLGSGPATFGFDFNHFKPSDLNQTAFWSSTFNQGISFAATLLADLGVLGILAFLFLFFALSRQWLKNSFANNSNLLIISTGVAYLSINLFIYPAFFSQLIFIFLGMGLLASGENKYCEMNFNTGSQLQKIKGLITFLGTILALALVLFMFYLTSQKYIAAIYYKAGLLDSSLDESLNNFNRAVILDPQSDLYRRALSIALISKAGEISRMPVLSENAQNLANQLQNTITLAVNNAMQATTINPLDALNWFNLGNIYENIIPTKDAEVFAEKNYSKAMGLDPQNPIGPANLGRMWIVSSDYTSQKDPGWQEKLNKAKSALDKSIALKSDYALAHFLMAQIYVREGNLNGVIKKVEDLVSFNPNDSGLLFQLGVLYYRNNQISQAQSVFERAVFLDQNYSNARYFLGLIYDVKGQTPKAIEQFKIIQTLNPDNAEVKSILNNLQSGKSALSGIVPPAQAPEKRTQTPVGSDKP